MNDEIKPCPICGVWPKDDKYSCGYTSPASTEKLHGCTCEPNDAKTVRKVTDEIWQCPRCGGLGTVSTEKEELREEAFKAEVFKVMLSNPEYMNLPDYYVKQIAWEAVKKFTPPIPSVESIEDIIKLHSLSQVFLERHNADEMDRVMQDIKELATALHVHLKKGGQGMRVPTVEEVKYSIKKYKEDNDLVWDTAYCDWDMHDEKLAKSIVDYLTSQGYGGKDE